MYLNCLGPFVSTQVLSRGRHGPTDELHKIGGSKNTKIGGTQSSEVGPPRSHITTINVSRSVWAHIYCINYRWLKSVVVHSVLDPTPFEFWCACVCVVRVWVAQAQVLKLGLCWIPFHLDVHWPSIGSIVEAVPLLSTLGTSHATYHLNMYWDGACAFWGMSLLRATLD